MADDSAGGQDPARTERAEIGNDKQVTALALGNAVVVHHYGGKRHEVAVRVQ